MRKIAAATLLATVVGFAVPVFAGDDDDRRLNVPAGDWKSGAEIKDMITAAGYRVREIEMDDGAYEVEVIDKDGVRMELHVHPATGEVMRGYDD